MSEEDQNELNARLEGWDDCKKLVIDMLISYHDKNSDFELHFCRLIKAMEHKDFNYGNFNF